MSLSQREQYSKHCSQYGQDRSACQSVLAACACGFTTPDTSFKTTLPQFGRSWPIDTCMADQSTVSSEEQAGVKLLSDRQ